MHFASRLTLLFLMSSMFLALGQANGDAESGNLELGIGLGIGIGGGILLITIVVLILRKMMLSKMKIVPNQLASTTIISTVKDYDDVMQLGRMGENKVITTVSHLEELTDQSNPLFSSSVMSSVIPMMCAFITKTTRFCVDMQAPLAMGRESAILLGTNIKEKNRKKVVIKIKLSSLAAQKEHQILQMISPIAGPRLLEHVLLPDKSVHGFVMEKGDISLVDYMRDENPDLEEIRFMFSKIGMAILELHKANIVHADISPKNIFNFGLNKWKLIGFGSCYAATDVYCRPKSTPIYSAPELIRLSNGVDVDPLPVSKSLDIWSFGMVLYECLMGIHQNNNNNNSNIGSGNYSKQIVSSKTSGLESFQQLDLRVIGSKYDDNCMELLESCLHFDASQRPGIEMILLSRFFKGGDYHHHDDINNNLNVLSDSNNNNMTQDNWEEDNDDNERRSRYTSNNKSSNHNNNKNDFDVDKRNNSNKRIRQKADLQTVTIHGYGIQWRKGHLIGAGAYGKVYVGLDMSNGKHVAVKEIQIDRNSSSSSSVEALMEEIEVMKRLEHPNIVRYIGTQREGNIMRIFLEFVSGGSLDAVLSKFGKLTESLAKMYSNQALRGLVYLHSHNIVHRDLKCGNLLVDDKGNVKLSDFGASKILRGNDTADGELLNMRGTPYFMAPEVIRQDKPGRKSDIWSFGCTVLQMINGQPPWSEKHFQSSVQALFFIASTDELPYWDRYSVTVELSAFIVSCLRKEQEERPTAAQLQDHVWYQISTNDNALTDMMASGGGYSEEFIMRTTSSSPREVVVPATLIAHLPALKEGHEGSFMTVTTNRDDDTPAANSRGSGSNYDILNNNENAATMSANNNNNNNNVNFVDELFPDDMVNVNSSPVVNSNAQVLSFLKGLAVQKLVFNDEEDDEEEEEEPVDDYDNENEHESEQDRIATMSSAFADLLSKESLSSKTGDLTNSGSIKEITK